MLDLSGGAPLFTAADLRDGYLRADPGDPAAVLKAVLKARDLTGTFDKPRYVTFTRGSLRAFALAASSAAPAASISARPARSRRPAITWRSTRISARAADNAPPSARPAPASYALPPADTLMRKLRALLTAYREAGGAQPIVLMHDDAHGAPLIDALARFGDGLARERAAARGQRGDASRAGSHRGGLRLRRVGGAAFCCAQSRATTSPA